MVLKIDKGIIFIIIIIIYDFIIIFSF